MTEAGKTVEDVIDAQLDRLNDLFVDGEITEETYTDLVQPLNRALLAIAERKTSDAPVTTVSCDEAVSEAFGNSELKP